jgi:hypothetical protein
MVANPEHYPRIEEYFIGDNQSVDTPIAPVFPNPSGPSPTPPVQTTDTDTVAVFQPLYLLPGDLIFLSVENFGPAPFVFSALQSNDNGVADAYGTINLRYFGASVASITVAPGGKAAALLETITKNVVWLKVPNASAYRVPQSPLNAAVVYPQGRVVCTHFGGELLRLERLGVFGNNAF